MPDNLSNILSAVSGKLRAKNIPYCVIGALALGYYGLPRYTSDIDLLAEEECRKDVFAIMKELDYLCFQEAGMFAQFELVEGFGGMVDFMFVKSDDGKNIIKDSVSIENLNVIQPTDYIILKLMAIANNPGRSAKDESDIESCIDLFNNKQISGDFKPVDMKKIILFAERFGQGSLLKKYSGKIREKKHKSYSL